MEYVSVEETANRWGLSARTVRNYCRLGKVPGAHQVGRAWLIPAQAQRPARKARVTKQADKMTLLDILQAECARHQKGGIYHRVQIDMTYNSNHIEGSRLTHEETRYIFETNTIGREMPVNANDIVETMNHFRCMDWIIEMARHQLSEKMIKGLHLMLKNGTTDSRQSWFSVGDYKKLPNTIGEQETTAPKQVSAAIRALLSWYKEIQHPTFDDLLEFHVRFERIHPFQDGNGRIGRLILFKECLRTNHIPFIITDDLKYYYYRGLKEWGREAGYLRDTCLTAQDRFRKLLAYYRPDFVKMQP